MPRFNQYAKCDRCKGDGSYTEPILTTGEVTGTQEIPCTLCNATGYIVIGQMEGKDEVTTLQSDIDILKADATAIEGSLTTQDGKIDTLRESVNDVMNKCNDIKQKVDEIMNKLNEP